MLRRSQATFGVASAPRSPTCTGRRAGSCRRAPVPSEFYSVPASKVPVLIFSGGLDPATPPRHGDSVAQRLGNAKHIVAPNLGHGISAQGCAPMLVSRFVRDATFDRVDGDCLARIPAPGFFVAIDPAAAPKTKP